MLSAVFYFEKIVNKFIQRLCLKNYFILILISSSSPSSRTLPILISNRLFRIFFCGKLAGFVSIFSVIYTIVTIIFGMCATGSDIKCAGSIAVVAGLHLRSHFQ